MYLTPESLYNVHNTNRYSRCSQFGEEIAIKTKLLATSPTIAGITEMVNRYYYSVDYSVDPDTLRINHPTKDVNQSVQIVLKKGRYRLESK